WRQQVGPDLYPVLRLLLPHKDRERATYGYKEVTLAKAFIQAFGMSEKSKDAQSLINWKKPDPDPHAYATGDFPSVLYQTIATRSSVVTGTMTIGDLNDLLDELSQGFRPSGKDAERRSAALRVVGNKCTANEIRWIVRIILKDLGIGVKETTVFSVFHPDAIDLFSTCSDLKKVSWDLADPNYRLHEEEKAVRLFKPFQPMLCGRTKTLRDAVKLGFFMEEKLDGERLQLHKRRNEFFYCSRKGKDYTYLYGGNRSEGSLTPFIVDAFHSKVKDVILDGEMLVWDPSIEKYLPFGKLKTSALDKSNDPDKPRPCFKIFDLLYINLEGARAPTLLTRKTLNVRLQTLKNLGLFKEVPGRLEFVTQRVGKTAEDVESFLEDIVEERGEGLVLKRSQSAYSLGGREGKWWAKVKPEYMDNMGETVDVLVVGGWIRGRVSTLICAVRDDSLPTIQGSDPHDDDEKSSTVYKTFVRIGSGLSLEDYEWINMKPWKPFNKYKPPYWLRVSPESGTEDKGDVFLEPEESFIITVKAASISPSDQYAAGMTMRFPRCQNIRHNFSLENCMSISGKLLFPVLTSRPSLAISRWPFSKRRKGVKKKVGLPSHKGQDLSGVESRSELFEGRKFHVIMASGPKQKYPKAEVERMIKEHGGSIHQSYSKVEGVTIIYGGTVKSKYPFSSIIKNDIHDIIKPEWIVDCIEGNSIVALGRQYYFHVTEETQVSAEYRGGEVEGEVHEDVDDVPSTSRRPMVPAGELNEGASERGSSETEDEGEDKDGVLVGPGNLDSDSWIHVISAQIAENAKEKGNNDKEKGKKLKGTDELGSSMEKFRERESDTESEGGLTEGEEIDLDEVRSVGSEDGDDFDITMGESDDAMEYDTEKIFKHLHFYIDTQENARSNGLSVEDSGGSDDQELINSELEEVERNIEENGGQVTSELSHPKLTHIILHK
ncbi:ATP dependent DNA ligase domain-containing protein, partial [Cantharellus anzutake]|uniref:ATP dependent DNA ligase domain-containing protein n=1 Tax=Cantharellus anzutake TaxID=1750568 RepID=UPI0019083FFC